MRSVTLTLGLVQAPSTHPQKQLTNSQTSSPFHHIPSTQLSPQSTLTSLSSTPCRSSISPSMFYLSSATPSPSKHGTSWYTTTVLASAQPSVSPTKITHRLVITSVSRSVAGAGRLLKTTVAAIFRPFLAIIARAQAFPQTRTIIRSATKFHSNRSRYGVSEGHGKTLATGFGLLVSTWRHSWSGQRGRFGCMGPLELAQW